MKFIKNVLLLALLCAIQSIMVAMKRSSSDDQQSAVKRQNTGIDIECSDGKKMAVAVDLLKMSPWVAEKIQNLGENAATEDAIFIAKVDRKTMQTVLYFMHLKLNNDDVAKAMCDYLHGMLIDGEDKDLFAAAKYLDLQWLQYVMIQAGFVPPFVVSMKDFNAQSENTKLQVPSLTTAICWELAKLCEIKGSLEDVPQFTELPQEIIEYTHMLHAVQFGVKNWQTVPVITLNDLIKMGVLYSNIKFDATITDAEIIDYLVAHGEEGVLDDICDFYIKNQHMDLKFNPYDLIVKSIRALSSEKIEVKYKTLKELSAKNSALKAALQFIYAKDVGQNIDDDVNCIDFFKRLEARTKELELEENFLCVPFFIGEAQNLDSIDVIQLTKLLNFLPFLEPILEKKISHVWFFGCKDMVKIPESLICLKQLKILYLKEYPLEKLPPFLKHMKSLSRLDLYDTAKDFECLPECLKNLLPKGCEICIFQRIGVSDDLKSFFEIKWKIDREGCVIL